MMDLTALLPTLVPKAIAWAHAQAEVIMATGVPLNDKGLALAKRVGVALPELVRVKYVPTLPIPEDPLLKDVALQAGLLGPGMVGMALDHGIFIVPAYEDTRLLSHELRHVHQYEGFGTIDAFMPVYLAQIAAHGYRDAPLEMDARAHEVIVA